MGKPAVSIEIEPVVFAKNSINLKSIPTVKTLLKDICTDIVESLCFPSRVEMDVPCVLETIHLDALGKRIKEKPKDIKTYD